MARLAGSVRVDTLTHRKPSAFKQNTGYTTRGRGRWRGHGRRRERGHAQAVRKQAVRRQAVRKQAVRRQAVCRY